MREHVLFSAEAISQDAFETFSVQKAALLPRWSAGPFLSLPSSVPFPLHTALLSWSRPPASTSVLLREEMTGWAVTPGAMLSLCTEVGGSRKKGGTGEQLKGRISRTEIRRNRFGWFSSPACRPVSGVSLGIISRATAGSRMSLPDLK